MSGSKGWRSLPNWMHTSRFFKKDLVKGGDMIETNPDEANLVSSHFYTTPEGKKVHYPVLDLDIDAYLIPSSTPGHHHLFINKLLSEEDYDKLLRTLHEVGIIQKGIIELQWEQDGMTCARLPGIKKEKNSLSSGGKIDISVNTDEYVKFKPGGKVINNTLPANISANKPGDEENSALKNFLFSDIVASTQKADMSGFKLYTEPDPNDLTPKIKSAMIAFKHLAEVSKTANKSLYEVVHAWNEFTDKMDLNESENKAADSQPF